MRLPHAGATLCAALCAALLMPLPQARAQDWRDEPYVGLRVRDSAGGVVVSWVLPGPLGGTGFESRAGLQRGDVILAAGLPGQPPATIASADDFTQLVDGLAAGDLLTIQARRPEGADPNAAVPRGAAGGAEALYTAEVASRDAWSGTVGRGLGERRAPQPREGEWEPVILNTAEGLGVSNEPGALGALLGYLAEVQQKNLDPNSLPAVLAGFERPLGLDAQAYRLADLAAAGARDPHSGLLELLHEALDVPRIDHEDEAATAEMHRAIRATREKWFADARRRGALKTLVRTLRDSVYIMEGPAEELIDVIRAAGADAETMLAWHLERLSWSSSEIERVLGAHAEAEPIKPEELPEQVRAAVTGDVLHYELRGGGAVYITGGPGPNEYDMGAISWVYDSGGDDIYRFREAPDDLENMERLIIDVAGDDRYESSDDFAGPAVGILGNALIDDRAGSDIYRTTGQFSIAAGLMGVGILIDRAGDDIYENIGASSGWAMGVGFYGAGLVLDLDGQDSYHGEVLTQGVGGPRGFGAIIDGAGDDRYKANGPNFASVYGTDGVYKSFSQGFGYGVRGYAAGGLGALWDLDGADRYEAGEFSQGCAYFFALGLLHDFGGNDTYIGNRYSQAAAAHQAIGVCIDDGGNDSYRAMTAASQSGAWDQSITYFLDRAGDDSYEADGLAQGSAAQQALAIFLDLSGDDTYQARGSAVHGQSSSDEYHWAADGVYSFSAFFDFRGDDTYSSGRKNGDAHATGAPDEDNPARATLYGVFMDWQGSER